MAESAANVCGAPAACAGVNRPIVTCDFANPSGGTLTTSFEGTTVVNMGDGAQITTGGTFPAGASASPPSNDD